MASLTEDQCLGRRYNTALTPLTLGTAMGLLSVCWWLLGSGSRLSCCFGSPICCLAPLLAAYLQGPSLRDEVAGPMATGHPPSRSTAAHHLKPSNQLGRGVALVVLLVRRCWLGPGLAHHPWAWHGWIMAGLDDKISRWTQPQPSPSSLSPLSLPLVASQPSFQSPMQTRAGQVQGLSAVSSLFCCGA